MTSPPVTRNVRPTRHRGGGLGGEPAASPEASPPGNVWAWVGSRAWSVGSRASIKTPNTPSRSPRPKPSPVRRPLCFATYPPIAPKRSPSTVHAHMMSVIGSKGPLFSATGHFASLPGGKSVEELLANDISGWPPGAVAPASEAGRPGTRVRALRSAREMSPGWLSLPTLHRPHLPLTRFLSGSRPRLARTPSGRQVAAWPL